MVKPLLTLAIAGFAIAAAAPVRAGSPWDAPSLALEMRGVHDSELFPGSALSTADRGAQIKAASETGRRLSKSTKFRLGVEAGGQLWSHFSEASYGWAGLQAGLRLGGAQLRGDVEWTPQRLKFPAELEGGRFERLETRLSLRQALGERWRFRVEGRHQDDDFVTVYDVRDASTNEGYAQLALRAGERVTLRADVLVGRTRATSQKYGHADKVVGGATAVEAGPWRIDGGVWSGLSRYRDARPDDSNFRRRDQWIQIRTEVRRAIGHGFAALASGEWTDQNSSRRDRSYTRTTVQLGFAWTAAGE